MVVSENEAKNLVDKAVYTPRYNISFNSKGSEDVATEITNNRRF